MAIERSKYSSRLTESEVEEIRAAPFAMRHTDVAKRYGVTPTTIARIRKGITWPARTHELVRVRVPAEVVSALEDVARADEMPTEELASSILCRWAFRYRKR